MSDPLLVDLYSGAGGAGYGYHLAGFDVIGVDITPQPRYPFTFQQDDALALLSCLVNGGTICTDDGRLIRLRDVAAFHSSPPCQRKSKMTNCRPGLAATYPDLIKPTHELLLQTGKPWVIENVDGAGLPGQDDLFGAHGVMLCASMFGRELYRHRWFLASFPLVAPHHPRHLKPASAAGHWKAGTVISVEGNCSPIALAREVMGIDWTNRDELSEAIPPAYTQYIGALLRAAIKDGPYSTGCGGPMRGQPE